MDNKTIKPWGYEVVWAHSSCENGYAGKLIYINAGHKLSFQYHKIKEETIYIKSGVLKVESSGMFAEGDSIFDFMSRSRGSVMLRPGECFHIPARMTHRFIAMDKDVELIEVSTKHLDDVVRLEDDYGRETAKDTDFGV